MYQGNVLSINITPASGEQMRSLDEAHAVAGKGLEGDRYFDTKPDSQVSLIAAEAIEAMERDTGLKLDHKDARRNIVTRDVPLNDLVGQDFQVGDVTLRGLRLSEPCTTLASLTDDRVLKGLVHRAGLKCEILNDGVIRVGDAVRPLVAS